MPKKFEQLPPLIEPLNLTGLITKVILAELSNLPFYESILELYKSPKRIEDSSFFLRERSDILDHIKIFYPKANKEDIITTFALLWEWANRNSEKDCHDK